MQRCPTTMLYCSSGRDACWPKLFLIGFSWVLGFKILFWAKYQPVDKDMILIVWCITYTYLVLGSGASACTWEFVNLKDTMQSAKHLEKQAGSTGWGQEREGGYAPWSVCFLWICVGRSLSWGWRLRWGRLAGGLGLPNYFALFLAWRTKVNIDCLPFLLRLKAVRCEGGRLFPLRSKESSLSATLVNELVSRQPWI